MTEIFAHRGSSGTFPENTFAAFKEAEKVGSDGIEIDVHLTRDDEIVIIHDKTVDRTTNSTGLVREYTLAEIKKLDAGSWFSVENKGEKIPTLKELLDWMQGNSITLNIELKNVTIQYPDFEKRIINEIEESGLEDRIIISSFNHYALKRVNELNPKIESAILYAQQLFEPWNYAKKLGARGLHPHDPKTDLETINIAQQNGFPVRIYTVNNEERMKELIDRGCSAIISDYPEKALRIKETLRVKN
ncbi:glycerophosphodiester phosphodiesterase [Cerasibacillus terrae]|nr:glycerophosphodiester phosphodiesterase [Cerasibacillus terrae]